MDHRHPVRSGVTVGAEVVLTGLIKVRGKSEFAPVTRQKACRVEVEVGDMDVVVLGHGTIADKLAGFPTATAVKVEGELCIATWTTGDGTTHRQTGVFAETVDAPY